MLFANSGVSADTRQKHLSQLPGRKDGVSDAACHTGAAQCWQPNIRISCHGCTRKPLRVTRGKIVKSMKRCVLQVGTQRFTTSASVCSAALHHTRHPCARHTVGIPDRGTSATPFHRCCQSGQFVVRQLDIPCTKPSVKREYAINDCQYNNTAAPGQSWAWPLRSLSLRPPPP